MTNSSQSLANFNDDQNVNQLIYQILSKAPKNKKKKNNFFPKQIINVFVIFFKKHKDKIISYFIFVIISSTIGVVLACLTTKVLNNFLFFNHKTSIPIKTGFNLRDDFIIVTEEFVRYSLAKCFFYVLTTKYTITWDDHLSGLVSKPSPGFSIQEIH